MNRGLSFSEPNLESPSHVSIHLSGYKEMLEDNQNWIVSSKSETVEYVSTHPLAASRETPESEEETIPPVQAIPNSPNLSQKSLPNSDFDVNCCCGARGDENIVYYQ